MRSTCLVLTIIIGLAANGLAEELYKVSLHSQNDAELLKGLEVETVLWVRGGYLVLADNEASRRLEASGLDFDLVASSVSREQLWMDGRRDRKNAERFELLYEDGGLRLFLISPEQLAGEIEPAEVYPLPRRHIEIRYRPSTPAVTPEVPVSVADDIPALIAQVEQDSLEAYVGRLEAYTHRLAGTDSNYASRDWIADKFEEFGYQTVEIDPFIGSQLWDRVPVQCFNVIARKEGTLHPEQQIVIGGHFDSVPDCPGADDNATGTACVLEIARILKDIETDKTFVFIAFDSEESWLWGSYHYVDEAVARGDDIVLMINPDMIAHWNNDTRADLYYGAENGYAILWSQLAQTYVGITGDLSGSTASDHLPFQEAGYDVIFVQEKNFSTNYHCYNGTEDISANLDFEYMTRMVKATLATLYTTDRAPRPVEIASVVQAGDGETLQLAWHPCDYPELSGYRISYWQIEPLSDVYTIDVPPGDTCGNVGELTEGYEYAFYVQAILTEGRMSLPDYGVITATPQSRPQAPFGVLAVPLREAIKVTWQYDNPELDFDHCAVIRDQAVIHETLDTVYIDDDPSLGADFHEYMVVSFDTEGKHSDTVGVDPFVMRAATLEANRILAVNRSSWGKTVDFVDETETGAFMREALSGYNFDYYSDTAAYTNPYDTTAIDLVDMLDYGVVIVGGEAGRLDEIGSNPEYNNGILDTLVYYLSIGGRLVVFGRWGNKGLYDTLDYIDNPYAYDDAYHDYFHIGRRILTPSDWTCSNPVIQSDLVGAHSQMDAYPALPWDSLLTLAHSDANIAICPVTEVSGIPFATFCDLVTTRPQVLYTYDSRHNDPIAEGQPVGWRYLGNDYRYVWFDIPLSFMQRSSAIAALRQAVEDLMSSQTPVDDDPRQAGLPEAYRLGQNYPNPFNPSTVIKFSLPARCDVNISLYNILGQRIVTLLDETRPAGTHRVVWDGTNADGEPVASGIYLYRMKAGDHTASKKMLLLR
ncbi:MAG: M28 family peptidase [Candidatus Zixiibacteriota bacterium]|nr:MAG: M28 family peptidase [candidate division Zixibacteria bacterium]